MNEWMSKSQTCGRQRTGVQKGLIAEGPVCTWQHRAPCPLDVPGRVLANLPRPLPFHLHTSRRRKPPGQDGAGRAGVARRDWRDRRRRAARVQQAND